MSDAKVSQLSAQEKRALLTKLLQEKSQQAEPQSYPLSYGQQALWFIDQSLPGSAAYNLALPVRIYSQLNSAALQAALQAIVNRHPALRTTFAVHDGEVIQKVHGDQDIPIERIDASTWSLETLQQQVHHAYAQPFDLERGPLIRVYLFRRAEDDHILMIAMHHIIYDGWSNRILFEELRDFYEAELSGKPANLPALQATYADFVKEQHELLSGPEGERLWAYWQHVLGGELPVLNLPTDAPRPAIQTDHGASQTFRLTQELTQQLRQCAQQQGVTLYTLLMAAFQVLLARYSGQTDILTGSPVVVGRDQQKYTGVINYFVNMITVRGDLSGNPPFLTFLQQIQEATTGALAHHQFPFPLLIERLKVVRDPSRSPLLQAVFGLRRGYGNQALSALLFSHSAGMRTKWGALECEYFDMPQEEGQFELTFDMVELAEQCIGIVRYNTDLFTNLTIERMTGHLTLLLESILAQPDCSVGQLQFLSDAERQTIVYDWNRVGEGALPQHTVHEMFEAQAAKTPEALAVVCGQQRYSYHELNQRANQLAHYLCHLGFGAETIIGLCVERTCDMIVGILGILKAGAAYMPMDPSYPQDRLAFMLDDAAAPLLLTQESLLPRLPERRARTVCLDWDWGIIAQHGEKNPDHITAPENLAYIIYTSGSTGQPKGAMITHQGLSNLAVAQIRIFDVRPDSRILQFASFSFDVATSDVVLALCSGATLYLTGRDGLLPGPDLTRALRDYAITHVELPVAVLAATPVEELPDLRVLIVGGEACPPELVARWSQNRRFFNAYGPTETTVCATVAECAGDMSRPPIGRPIDNVYAYILDQYRQPVPIGVPGELYIGGSGVGRGYLNRPDLTAERFINDPFFPESEGRLYKTGDMARYLPDGTIEFIGRADNQVKIRGFRIELEEIETALSQSPDITAAVVLVKEPQPGTKQLVAYVMLAENAGDVTIQALRAFLKSRLPEYMLPAQFVFLDAFPLTPNGKVDRRALPDHDASARHFEQPYVAPRTPEEQQLAAIWSAVLQREQVGIHDNFFDLGGDSILSIQIIARATQAGLHLTPNQIFQHQTIAELAPAIETRAGIQAEQGLITGQAPVTAIQQWFFERDFAEPHHWNQAILLETLEPLEPAVLEQAAGVLLRHHDALRSRFTREADRWLQEYALPDEIPVVNHCDLSTLAPQEQPAALQEEFERIHKSVNFTHGPLFRMTLAYRGHGLPDYLLLVAHHLTIDGISWRILVEDLQAAYLSVKHGAEVTLPPKTTSFQSWATHIRTYARSNTLFEEIEYWTARPVDVATLPVDVPEASLSAANTEASGAHVRVMLDQPSTSALLHSVHQAYNTNINDILLTALAQTLGAWMGTSAILLDLEAHGREELFDDTDVSRTIGWFTAMFPVNLPVIPSEQSANAIKAVKESLRQVPQKGVGYGLLHYVHPDAAIRQCLQSLPEAQIGFNYLGQIDRGQTDPPLFRQTQESAGPLRGPHNQRVKLLDIDAFIAQERLTVTWTYSRELHRHGTIERLARQYIECLRILIEHCQMPDTGAYTPSDFPDAELDQKQLDNLLDALDGDEIL